MRLIRLIRWFLWITFYRSVVVKATSKVDALIGYPMLVWSMFQGRNIYLEYGWEVYKEASNKRAVQLKEDIIDALTPEEWKSPERKYRSKTQTIKRLRKHKQQEEAAALERERLLAEIDHKLEKATFKNGTAKL